MGPRKTSASWLLWRSNASIGPMVDDVCVSLACVTSSIPSNICFSFTVSMASSITGNVVESVWTGLSLWFTVSLLGNSTATWICRLFDELDARLVPVKLKCCPYSHDCRMQSSRVKSSRTITASLEYMFNNVSGSSDSDDELFALARRRRNVM